jgi:hypothetical protein
LVCEWRTKQGGGTTGQQKLAFHHGWHATKRQIVAAPVGMSSCISPALLVYRTAVLGFALLAGGFLSQPVKTAQGLHPRHHDRPEGRLVRFFSSGQEG